MGTLPHEKPPKFVDPNEALEYFWKQFHRPEILKQIWGLLEGGATAFMVARVILYKAALMGIIQVNLGIVIYPTVQKMIIAIGQSKGIKVKIHPKFRDATTDRMMNQKLNEKLGHKHGKPIPFSALKAMNIPKADEITKAMQKLRELQPPTPKAPSVAPAPAPQGTGLLSKVSEG
jgi:hypothetical protein